MLVAHGSRQDLANAEVAQIAAALRLRLAARFATVSHAFLELSPPDIALAIDTLVAAGHVDIWLLPYFLTAGKHIQQDIPAIVDAKTRQYPAVKMHILPYIGAADGVVELLFSLVHD